MLWSNVACAGFSKDMTSMACRLMDSSLAQRTAQLVEDCVVCEGVRNSQGQRSQRMARQLDEAKPHLLHDRLLLGG